MDSLRRGTISQTAVLNRLVELGLEVLLPWEPYLRYDLAYYVTEEQRHFGFFVHRECRLVRIQVKSGRLKPDGGSFVFSHSLFTIRARQRTFAGDMPNQQNTLRSTCRITARSIWYQQIKHRSLTWNSISNQRVLILEVVTGA